MLENLCELKCSFQTAALASSVLYDLAKNPGKQEILRNEIMTILPEKDSPFTEENTKNMPYLRACIKESFRMRPIVLANFRSLGEDTVIRGHLIPKGV